MYNGIEYKITFLNEKKNRIGIEQIGNLEDMVLHEVGQKIKFEDMMYKIVYIHSGKNRISIEPL